MRKRKAYELLPADAGQVPTKYLWLLLLMSLLAYVSGAVGTSLGT